jgi:ribonuclease-3
LHLLGHRLDELAERVGPDADPSPNDHKSRLQERCAHDGGELPAYTWTESGPELAKTFQVQVRIDGKAVATGTGRSKKQAEQAAAAIALALLEEQPHQPE